MSEAVFGAGHHAALLDVFGLVRAGRIEAAERALDTLPSFVFHGDLHAGNMLRDETGRVTVIDRDTWALAPVGVGWPIPEPDGAWVPPIDLDRLRATRGLRPKHGERDLLLAAAVHASMKAVRRKRWPVVAHRLALLADLA